jgi:prepilin-type processing-associated H-X9-DG protein
MIVIVIISILVAMLLPAMGAARENARFVVCRTNLQQISMCCGYYQTDYKYAVLKYIPWPYPPGPAGYTAEIAPSYYDQFWPGMLYVKGYLRVGKTLRCPSDAYTNHNFCWQLSDPKAAGATTPSYAMNYWYEFLDYSTPFFKVESAKYPDRTQYISDNADDETSAGNQLVPDFTPDGVDFTRRHGAPNGWMNMMWLDGHITPLHYNDHQSHYYYWNYWNASLPLTDRWFLLAP